MRNPRRSSSRVPPPALSHAGSGGEARMVDVGDKPITRREAVARGRVTMSRKALVLVKAGKGPKGRVIDVARLAGIMAAKRTSDLIPLCHPLPLTAVEVKIDARGDGFDIEAVTRTTAQTGVEMEALTAVSVAALTLYDMAKAVDKEMTIGGIELVAKSGGRTGTWVRAERSVARTKTPQRAG